GPEELARIAMDDPIRAVLGGREASHARHPLALAQRFVVLVDEVQTAAALELPQDVRRPVDGAVVGGDDEVDPVLEVVAEVVLDEIRLVAHEQRHPDLHGFPVGLRAGDGRARSRRTDNDDSTTLRRRSIWSSSRRASDTSASPSVATSAAKSASSATDGVGSLSFDRDVGATAR